MKKTFSAVLTREDEWVVAHCPEVGVTSQGKTKKSALSNLTEAVELYLEEDPLHLSTKREVVEFTVRVTAHA
tara:strand:- start:760 stop:975 length:216 start_codon:yes stop_codon:yes gene_type:complete